MKNIIFVTEIKALSNKEATSTHIMSYNLLKGFHDNNCNVSLIAIYSGEDDQIDEIKKSYSHVANNIICVKSKLGHNVNKYKQILKMLYLTYFSKGYKKVISGNLNLEDSVLISHNPSIESIFICKYLKSKCVKYIQYWSDPIAISGIYPKNLNYKRVIHKVVENKCLSYADLIIYGTKVLFDAQKEIYKKYQNKMDYINISYTEKSNTQDANKNNNFIYAGNYYSNIRNIKPLYQAFNEEEIGRLVVYGKSDLKLQSTKNVEIHERISPDQLKEIEKEYNNIVCITNINCLQIPGKIFYDMSDKKNILVILDGEYKEEIKSYLDTYKRFITCYNTEEDIKTAILSLKESQFSSEYAIENFSPKQIVKTLLEKI